MIAGEERSWDVCLKIFVSGSSIERDFLFCLAVGVAELVPNWE